MDTTVEEDCTITQLARKAQTGDSDALALLADILRGPLFAIAYAVLGHYDDAQDAVANTLLRLCRYLPTLHSPEKVRAWAHHIARNEAHRLYTQRSLQSQNRSALRDTVSGSTSTDSVLLLDIERLLRTLPVEQAHTVTLFYWEGFSVREIAERLGRPEGTIKYWLHRGRTYLHSALEGYVPMTTPASAAVIVSSDLSPVLLAPMTDALKAAGWNTVRHSSASSPLSRDEHGQVQLADIFEGCQCVVLDETITGRSAFEWLLLFRTRDAGRQIPVLLLIAGERPEAQRNDTVLAAYLAGFDMCLTKPFDLNEFQHFAKRLVGIGH